jgi:hypothetical protein
MFPHSFVNRDRLNYNGNKPDISFYLEESKINDSKIKIYESLPELFNLKEECLKYLNKVVLGLLEAMNKVSKHYSLAQANMKLILLISVLYLVYL